MSVNIFHFIKKSINFFNVFRRENVDEEGSSQEPEQVLSTNSDNENLPAKKKGVMCIQSLKKYDNVLY